MTDQDPKIAHATQQQGRSQNKLALIISIVLAALIVVGGLSLVFLGLGGASTPQNSQNNSGSAPLDLAPLPAATPQNMASGGAVFKAGQLPIATQALAAGSVPAPYAADRVAGAIDIQIYVDYRCPHCMVFEETNAGTLAAALNNENVTVEVRPLTFMDRYSAGTAYSSRAANLFACTVEHQPESAWAVHNILLNQAIQPSGEGPGHDNETLLQIAAGVMPEVGAALSECVRQQTHLDFVQATTDWTFNHQIPFANDPNLKVEGTPMIVVAGVVYPGDIANAAEFKNFLQQQSVALD